MIKNKTPLDEFAKLLENPSHNLSVDVYNEDVKVIKESGVKKHKSKYTLNEIGNAIMELAKSFTSFKQEVNDRFDNLEKDVKDINIRLDYIVKANNLEDSK
ncbi:MAG: hypothetical protein MJ213_03165 [Bacilli bacterium]|nr:hypothetical protein [Bacilli bacterium]